MRAVAKGLLWAISLAAVLLVSTLLYLRYGDLSRHQGRVEDLLSGLVGHDIHVNGEFELEVGRTTRLSAENVDLSNPDWKDNPQLLSIGRVSVAIDTWSLYEGPLVIEDLTLLQLEIHSELNGDGQHNWSPEEAPVTSEEGDEAATVIGIESFSLQTLVLSHNDTVLTARGDIQGSFTANLSTRPALSLTIASESLAVSVATPVTAQKDDSDSAAALGLLLSDAPLGSMETLDIAFSVTIDELRIAQTVLTDVVVKTTLSNGNIRAMPISFREVDGSVDLELELLRKKSHYAASAALEIDNLHIGTVWAHDAGRASLPVLSGSMSLQGEGHSLHQIMASSSGKTTLNLGPGRIKSVSGTGLFGDVILQVLRKLNPLRSEDPYTSLECAVLALEIEKGVANINELAAQTNKMMISGDGEIDFDDESLALTVRAKPREGFGLSVGGVANSFFKLGGTLASPKLQFDAAGGATTAGAAVVTGGLSLVARGLWDRISAANDMCDEVLASETEATSPDDAAQSDQQQSEQQQ